MTSERTPHASSPHTGESPPVWGERSDGPRPPTGDRAAETDRKSRAAWGVVMRSAYLSRVRLPLTVAPGNVREARFILERIEGCLVEGERWTRTERARLRGMREAWERRAGGRDVEFMLTGWVKRPPPGDRRRQDTKRARGLARIMEALEV